MIRKNISYLLLLHFGIIFFTQCEKEDFGGLPVDGDGNVYDTVVIGTQVWMAENLKTTKYNDGSEITYFDNAQKWPTLPVGGYGWYDSNPVNKDIYGALYNAKAIHVETLCPKGWHLPITGEWTTLIDYLGGGEVAAKKLREQGDYHWIISGNKEGTNESGFTALAGGEKYAASYFGGIGFYGGWWASALNGNSDYVVRIDCENNILISKADTRGWVGFSVRCIKDD
jgi:uncharacterized protein (TIGR02145 family)